MFYGSSGSFIQTPLPFILNTVERTLLDDLAGRILDAGIDLHGSGPEYMQSARIIADPLLDPKDPVCLCSGTGELLLETLAGGFRLTPSAERETVAKAADALAARLIVAMAPSAESTFNQDDRVLDNVYRAGLGLPVQSPRLGEDQLGIIAREARTFAGLMNLAIRVGTDEDKPTNEVDVGWLMHQMDEAGQAPMLSFVDRATGGRPGVVGSISLINPETFFASFSVSFLVAGEPVTREGLGDGASLRAALIELGRARLAV